jgi:Na+/H+-dicarboxylate symporter
METFFWLALALPAVTDDFFTNLILMLVAPVIVVVGGLLVTGVSEAGHSN